MQGIPTDDLVYHAVNIQSQKTNEKEVLSQDSKVNLKRLNWPDYMLYQVRALWTLTLDRPMEYLTGSVQKTLIKAANATLWEKINHFGYERVQKIADEIDQKSKILSNECIDDNPPSPPTAKIQVSHFYES